MPMKDYMSVAEFFTQYASTEERAIEIFTQTRWGDGVSCPYCRSKRIGKGTDKQPIDVKIAEEGLMSVLKQYCKGAE